MARPVLAAHPRPWPRPHASAPKGKVPVSVFRGFGRTPPAPSRFLPLAARSSMPRLTRDLPPLAAPGFLPPAVGRLPGRPSRNRRNG